MSKFKCKVCGYIYEGDEAPEVCPVCGAPKSEFEMIEGPKKKRGFLGGKNSNPYIIFYAVVMTVLVAAILSITSLSLKERQDANVLNEKKDAIAAALGLAAGSYDSQIEAYVVGNDGAKVEEADSEKLNPLKMLFSLESWFEKGLYPVFEDSQNGEYVFPVIGKGLWGDIWGYVAFENDLDTIKGVVFSHASETPGLGAEIATPKFWAMFPGKTIFEGNDFVSVAVVKGGAKQGDSHAVDAITGGTKTSAGLQNMLRESLDKYVPFIVRTKNATQSSVESEVEDVQTIEQSVEPSNEVENNEQ